MPTSYTISTKLPEAETALGPDSDAAGHFCYIRPLSQTLQTLELTLGVNGAWMIGTRRVVARSTSTSRTRGCTMKRLIMPHDR